MDAAMAGQGAAVTESLLAVRLFAHMGALARMSALVDSQSRTLDE